MKDYMKAQSKSRGRDDPTPHTLFASVLKKKQKQNSTLSIRDLKGALGMKYLLSHF